MWSSPTFRPLLPSVAVLQPLPVGKLCGFEKVTGKDGKLWKGKKPSCRVTPSVSLPAGPEPPSAADSAEILPTGIKNKSRYGIGYRKHRKA
jgi:hypothetical protein